MAKANDDKVGYFNISNLKNLNICLLNSFITGDKLIQSGSQYFIHSDFNSQLLLNNL